MNVNLQAPQRAYFESLNLSNTAIVFDVGANVGQFTDIALQLWDCEVHCFEPNPEACKILRDLYKFFYGQVVINEVALSYEEGWSLLYFDDKTDYTASLYKRTHIPNFPHGSKSIEVKVGRLYDYIKEHEIDLVKLDAEGNEYSILQGAYHKLKRIKRIQWEFNGWNVESRIFFKDFWDFLSPDYNISLIKPNGLEEIYEYDVSLERFDGTFEYVATRKDL